MRPRRGMGLSLPQIRGSGRQPHQLSLSHIFLSTVSLPTDTTHTNTAGSLALSLTHTHTCNMHLSSLSTSFEHVCNMHLSILSHTHTHTHPPQQLIRTHTLFI